jgi:hypothetical protein
MEYCKMGDWKNTCYRADDLSSNKCEKIKDPGKVADVFNSSFPSAAENLNLHTMGK